MGVAEVERVGSSGIADLPALCQAGHRSLVGVKPGQPRKDLVADGERRWVVDQGRIERLRVFRLDQLEMGGAGRPA